MQVTENMTYGIPIYIGQHKDKDIKVFMAYRIRHYNHCDGDIAVEFHVKAAHKNTWEAYNFFFGDGELESIWELCIKRLEDCKKDYYRRFCLGYQTD